MSKLKRKTDAGFESREAGEQSVIITFASTQTVTCIIESYAGNGNKVDSCIVGEEFSGRFFNTITVRSSGPV